MPVSFCAKVVLGEIILEDDVIALAHERAHQRRGPASQPAHYIKEWPLAVVERYVIKVVEHQRLAQRTQLGVHPAASEHQRRFRRDVANLLRHAKRAVHIAGEGRGDGDNIGSLRGDQLARDFVDRFVDQCGLARQCLVQRIERGCARCEALAVARQLEARIDAVAPHVGEIVDVQACEIPRLLGGTQRAERGHDVFVVRLLEAWAFRQKRAADDAERQRGITALQEADRWLNRVGVAIGVRQKVPDRRRHDGALWRRLCALAQLIGHASDERRGKQPQEQGDRSIGLGNLETEIRGVQAQEARQIRRRGVRRIELDHRRRDEQEAHAVWRVAQAGVA